MTKKKLSLKKKTGGKTTGDLNKIKASYIEPYKKGGKLPMYEVAGEIQLNPNNVQQNYWDVNSQFQAPYNYNIEMPEYQYSQNPQITPPAPEYTQTKSKKTTKASLNPSYTNIQGGRSATDTFLTGLSNLPKAIQDPSNPANWAAVGDLPMTGAKAITSAIGARKVNPRNAKYVADLTKQAQLEPYQMTYFDDQYGTMKNPVTLAHGGGIPSKFRNKFQNIIDAPEMGGYFRKKR